MSHTLTRVPAEVLRAYGLQPDLPSRPFSGGHINKTLLLEDAPKKLMFQRINRFVFPQPENIMENMAHVTAFLHQKVNERGGDPAREVMQIVKTVDDALFYVDEAGEYWRCVYYIDDTVCHEFVSGPDMLKAAGFAFGDFQNLLSDFPADTLHEIILNFHNTPERYRQLTEAVASDAAGRTAEVQEELAFAKARAQDCHLLTDLLADGSLPLKVTHNDTKMSNILFDRDSGKPVCVIDLDTVMPGLTAFDFGDSIRAGASTAAEDETDLSKVVFSLPHFKAYTEGFLQACGATLTPLEAETLADGAKLMTLEVGMRFLADYLNGDVYFGTQYPRHNLDRARNQFHLVAQMETAMADMKAFVLERYACAR